MAAPTECDLVMKGGITSGVVYPSAVRVLADTYRFRNIGGASAGAIAAAAAAAAEYGRQTGHGGFDVLQDMTKELEQPGFLTGMFQPTPKARPLYRLLVRTPPSTFGSSPPISASPARCPCPPPRRPTCSGGRTWRSSFRRRWWTTYGERVPPPTSSAPCSATRWTSTGTSPPRTCPWWWPSVS